MRSASWILISSGSTGRITRGTRAAFLVAEEVPVVLVLPAAAEEEEDGAEALELAAAGLALLAELDGATGSLLGPSSSAVTCFFAAFLLCDKKESYYSEIFELRDFAGRGVRKYLRTFFFSSSTARCSSTLASACF